MRYQLLDQDFDVTPVGGEVAIGGEESKRLDQCLGGQKPIKGIGVV